MSTTDFPPFSSLPTAVLRSCICEYLLDRDVVCLATTSRRVLHALRSYPIRATLSLHRIINQWPLILNHPNNPSIPIPVSHSAHKYEDPSSDSFAACLVTPASGIIFDATFGIAHRVRINGSVDAECILAWKVQRIRTDAAAAVESLTMISFPSSSSSDSDAPPAFAASISDRECSSASLSSSSSQSHSDQVFPQLRSRHLHVCNDGTSTLPLLSVLLRSPCIDWERVQSFEYTRSDSATNCNTELSLAMLFEVFSPEQCPSLTSLTLSDLSWLPIESDREAATRSSISSMLPLTWFLPERLISLKLPKCAHFYSTFTADMLLLPTSLRYLDLGSMPCSLSGSPSNLPLLPLQLESLSFEVDLGMQNSSRDLSKWQLPSELRELRLLSWNEPAKHWPMLPPGLRTLVADQWNGDLSGICWPDSLTSLMLPKFGYPSFTMDHILFWQPPASLTDFQVHQVYCGTGPPLGIDARIVPQRIVWPPKLDIIRDVFFTYIERPDAPISDSSSSSSSRDGNLALRARCVTRTLSDLPSSIHTLHCMGMLDFVREGPSREEWPDVEEIVDSEAATGVQQQMIAPSIPCPHLTELYFRLTLCPLPTSACPIQFPSSLTRLFIVRTEDESGLYLFELRPFPKWSFSPHRLQQISIAFLYLPRRLGSLPQFAALRILQLRIHSVQDELCSKLNNDSDANAFWPPELEQLDIIANARGAVGQSAFERKKRELLKQTLIWDAPLSALRLPSSLKHLTLWSNCPLNHSCGSHHFVPLARLNEEYEDPSTNGHLSGVSQSLPLHLESLAIISVKRLDLLARIIKQHANIRTLRIGRTSAATLEEHFLPTLFDPLPDFQSPPLSLARIHVDVFEVATPGLYLQTYYSNATCGRITNEIRTVQRTVARYRNSHRISVSSSPDPPPAPHSPSSLISSDASSMWWTQCTDSRIGFDWD